MQTEVVPDDEEQLCDGSGWITHGDGHKTECPGCSACKNKNPEPETEGCQCGCGKKDCQCEKAKECIPSEDAKVEEPKYYIYHFGAKWCAPCEKMKATTWKDQDLLKLINDKDAKLFFYDEGKSEDKEFFKFYKITKYPTLIIVEVDNLSNPIHRSSGFLNANSVAKILGDKLDGE